LLHHYLYKRKIHNYNNLTACLNLYRTRLGFILRVTVFLLCVSTLQYECALCLLTLGSIAVNIDFPYRRILILIPRSPEVQAKTYMFFYVISGHFTLSIVSRFNTT
jgi:hypothetical protein